MKANEQSSRDHARIFILAVPEKKMQKKKNLNFRNTCLCTSKKLSELKQDKLKRETGIFYSELVATQRKIIEKAGREMVHDTQGMHNKIKS